MLAQPGQPGGNRLTDLALDTQRANPTGSQGVGGGGDDGARHLLEPDAGAAQGR